MICSGTDTNVWDFYLFAVHSMQNQREMYKNHTENMNGKSFNDQQQVHSNNPDEGYTILDVSNNVPVNSQ